jgi:DnaJ-class molecular chaperone
MSKAITKQCKSCHGHHTVTTKVTCGRCRGDGKEMAKKEFKCSCCHGTGRYVRKLAEHKFIVKPCRRCRGRGVKTRAVPVGKCKACHGAGVIEVRTRCADCHGKGKVVLNQVAAFWPEGADKKLQLV